MSTTDPDDFVTRAARRARELIETADVLPPDARGALRDLADRAETAVRDVTDRAGSSAHDFVDRAEDLADRAERTVRDAAETVATAAREATDDAHRRYRHRTRVTNAVGAAVISGLVVALVASRRRE
jgi:ElaB/YqjD/DUF883 family membrane-anchored ribosome-binding protein